MVTWALTGPPAVAPSVCDVPAEAKASRQVSSGASGEGFPQLGREKHIKHCIERTFILKEKKKIRFSAFSDCNLCPRNEKKPQNNLTVVDMNSQRASAMLLTAALSTRYSLWPDLRWVGADGGKEEEGQTHRLSSSRR